MVHDIQEDCSLTAIIPVTRMAGRFQNLEKWVYQEEVKDIQLIFVHDIQDNETSDELIRIVSKLSNAEVVEDRFGGPGLARNAGLDLVKDGWVTFWDSDDIPEVAEVKEMIRKASEKSKRIAAGGFHVKSLALSKETTSHNLQESTDLDLLAEIGMIPGLWRWSFQREIIGSTQFMPFLMAEDLCFLFDLKLTLDEIYVHNKFVYTYFVGDKEQLTQNPKAIPELLKSTSYLKDSINDANSNMSNLGALLITRQIFTALKKGNFLTKIRMILQVSSMIHLIVFSKRSSFIRAFKLLKKLRKPLFND